MKKAVFALLLLSSLTLLAAWNLRHLEKLTGELTAGIDAARQHCRQGDYAAAESSLDAALDRWLRSDGYTHVFIRHSEIDTATDMFCDLRGCILAEDSKGAEAEAEKLIRRLRSICAMERISVKSVF